jgi:UTP:GlnB (protein PII) uridylyltransferase
MAESMTLNKKSVDGNNTITVPHFKIFDEAPVTMHRIFAIRKGTSSVRFTTQTLYTNKIL